MRAQRTQGWMGFVVMLAGSCSSEEVPFWQPGVLDSSVQDASTQEVSVDATHANDARVDAGFLDASVDSTVVDSGPRLCESACSPLEEVGACAFGSQCATVGVQNVVEKSFACREGQCVETSSTSSERPCTRAPQDLDPACATCTGEAPPNVMGEWSACAYADGVCSERGTRRASLTTYVCEGASAGSSSWVPSVLQVSDTDGCSRTTETMSCGTTEVAAWGACISTDSCGLDGEQSRTTTSYACASNRCESNQSSEMRACARARPQACNVDAVATGEGHSCVLQPSGALRCWGRNNSGQLGDQGGQPQLSPVAVYQIDGSSPANSAVSVAAGDNHSCAVRQNGSVWCWGNNPYGQLGNGSASTSSEPVLVSGLSGDVASQVATQVSVGGTHSCAILYNGGVKCWGWNLYGQLGTGNTSDSLVPVVVPGLEGGSSSSTVLSIAAGGTHACAVRQNGSVLCWGRGDYGQLGDGMGANRNTPTLVNGFDGSSPASTAVLVAAGTYHSCALMQNGSVKCWGYNFSGQLGDGSSSTRNAPVAVMGISGSAENTRAVHLAVGSEHTCAVLQNGAARCWGKGMSGQLGTSNAANSNVPAEVFGIDGASEARSARLIDAGGFHSCALMQNGRVRCWGYGSDGQLGDGIGAQSDTPVEVSGI